MVPQRLGQPVCPEQVRPCLCGMHQGSGLGSAEPLPLGKPSGQTCTSDRATAAGKTRQSRQEGVSVTPTALHLTLVWTEQRTPRETPALRGSFVRPQHTPAAVPTGLPSLVPAAGALALRSRPGFARRESRVSCGCVRGSPRTERLNAAPSAPHRFPACPLVLTGSQGRGEVGLGRCTLPAQAASRWSRWWFCAVVRLRSRLWLAGGWAASWSPPPPQREVLALCYVDAKRYPP